jgi:hypothetical protein
VGRRAFCRPRRDAHRRADTTEPIQGEQFDAEKYDSERAERYRVGSPSTEREPECQARQSARAPSDVLFVPVQTGKPCAAAPASPIILSQIAQVLMGFVDTVMSGHAGAVEQAVVGSALRCGYRCSSA